MTKARDLAQIMSGGFTASDIPSLDTAKLTTGTVDLDRLGTGVPTNALFLSGDNTWATPTDTNTVFDDSDVYNNEIISVTSDFRKMKVELRHMLGSKTWQQ
jgi:hypothetical protein